MVVLYYILKLSVGLIIIWLFYQLVLRRLTFYNWNRWYLVICPALAFLLPLIDISALLEKNNWNKTTIVSVIPQIPAYPNPSAVAIPAKSIPEQIIGWLPLLIVLGATVMLVRLMIQYFSLQAMRRSSTLLLNGPVKVYQVDKPVIPFSFGNSIFLNQHLHGEEELKEIIRHEFIHVKQRHTFDIIWSEIICILTWYNPFSWLLRKATRQNLEFIADRQVLKTGLDRREYQYLLLKVIGVPSFSIASNFNFKSLKKRIAMMNKVKSARVHLVRFLLLLPVVAILLVAFRNAAKHRQQIPPPSQTAVADTVPGKKAFPENVRSFYYSAGEVTVILKNGKEEKYDMNDDKERAAFEKKYGGMPAPPAPPIAPAGPAHPEIVDLALASPVPDEPGRPVIDIAEPIPPTPPVQDDCYNAKGYCLQIINSPKGQMVLIAHKDKGKKDLKIVRLDDWKNDKKYEEKYGKLPDAPPPPPLAPHPPALVKHDMPEGVSSVHVKDYDAVVTNVDGTIEKYNLRLAEDKSSYERRIKPIPKLEKMQGVIVYDDAHKPVIMDVAESRSHKVIADVIETAPARAQGVSVHDFDISYMHDPTTSEAQEILAVITRNTSFKELEQLKADLKAKGITLTWINMKATDGKLTMVEGKLSAGSSKCHFQVDDFTRLTLTSGKDRDGRKTFHVHSSNKKSED